MNPIIIKGLAVALVAGSGAGSYGIYYGINSWRTVSHEIKEFLLTDNSTDEAWKQHLGAYKTLQDKWLGNVSDESTWIRSIKKWCNESLKTSWSHAKFSELSKKASKWCVDTEDIKERVKRTIGTGKSLISDTNTEDSWKTGWNSYNTNKSGKEISNISSTQDPGWKELKTFCLEAEFLHASSHETLKERYKDFCTK
ncbi:hypothetical protein MHC_00895 [Mycoplasma haemocanis str. Illinois]|uniref:Uncharacterized protein n=1 Tax=Mycoplasma haemocanis (strain Illinois) TaxID=1111676 RepID=H6N5T5_MYCHN|nr:hypothetical protein [Mycoplasma haemocanis]AEW45045.1 hypothetical protein MHC_00895 [Mycoplasma haemocanis str. Illinois]